MPFSTPDPQGFELSPLGAALVEAMPDRKLKYRIETRFKKKAECPASANFDKEQVECWYKERGQVVKAI